MLSQARAKMEGHKAKTRTGSPRPFLRWAGSKRALLPRLAKHWGNGYKRYVEPFMGSACLFFALDPPAALLGDINADLVDTFISVRDHPRAVYNRVKKIPRGKASYLRQRALNPLDMDDFNRAARFIFLNRFCFNGLYRTNMRGHFNVPYAPSGTGEVPTWARFFRAAKALRKAKLRCADFEELMGQAKDGDFFYLDPPYATSRRRVFREYSPDSFSTDDLDRLAGALRHLNTRGATFVVSYAYCSEGLAALSEWHPRKVSVQRNIAGFAKHRRKAYELVATNLDPRASDREH